MAEVQIAPLRFTGHANLPYRLVLSLLTGRPIHISSIRADSPTAPGLAAHEISLLRLLESLTNGSTTQISYTGTVLAYHPGLITGTAGRGLGSAGIDGVIPCRLPETNTRGLSYFLLPVCLLAPYAKGEVNVRFEGPGVITAAVPEHGDVSVDTVRTAVLPLFAHFGVPIIRLELRVVQRACASSHLAPDSAGGIVELRFAGQLRGVPRTIHLHGRPGRIKNIRGVAYCVGVSASGNARMIHEARAVVNKVCGDVRIAAVYEAAPRARGARQGATEGNKGAQHGSRRSTGIGFGVSLIAEMTNGTIYAADDASPPSGGGTPEDTGRRCGLQLLETISHGGAIGRLGMPLLLVGMGMGAAGDLGRLRLGRDTIATEDFITLARDWKTFGGAAWGLRDADSGDRGGGGVNGRDGNIDENGSGDEDDEDDDGDNDDGDDDHAPGIDFDTDIIVSVKGSGIGNVGKGVA